jgi:hypothetical protein
MKRWLTILLAIVLAGGVAGCGGDKDKGANKDKDLPRAPDKGEKK